MFPIKILSVTISSTVGNFCRATIVETHLHTFNLPSRVDGVNVSSFCNYVLLLQLDPELPSVLNLAMNKMGYTKKVIYLYAVSHMIPYLVVLIVNKK